MSEYEEYVCRFYPDSWGEKSITLFGVPIVRCRDCKHYTYADKEHNHDDWCKKHDHIAWSVNGFCAWSERKADA